MKNRTYIRDLSKKVGEEVTIAGFVDIRRDHGKLIFIDLRDESGKVQMIALPSHREAHELASAIRPEWVISVIGKVNKRPEKMANKDEPNGEIELEILSIQVLSKAETPPIDVRGDGREIGEEARLKYRYLDLRRPRLQHNIRMRHRVVSFFRNYLTAKGFVEVETPLLTRSTPEGARDYIVPSRIDKGKFYALPQSPQQYKQLLMVAGFEKYFQIARALRDEDTRGDRQPEHTQLDIEMSFVTRDEVMALVETMTMTMMRELYPEKKVKTPWPRITYCDAMERYGNDKPDMRENKNDPNEIAFGWVIDFPSFEMNKETGGIQPVHHMFVQPNDASVSLLDTDPLAMTSTQYDWVCNGFELASGSIRITDPALQLKVFKLLGMSEEKARNDFGHLLDAFSFGVPPHGGIAPGIDRLLMILQGEPNIREVIAFAKTGEGRDPMMGAPAEVDPQQLKELGIKLAK